MYRFLLPLAAIAGCSDYELQGSDEAGGKYNPPDLEVAKQVDAITQVTVPAVDVLWIVDNSCSMAEEQTALRENFQDFMVYFAGSGLDYHVGVVSTDMDNASQSGKLIQDDGGGARFIDSSVAEAEAIASFQQRADLGIRGSGEERGKDAAFAALTSEVNATNADFYRPDAILSMIVVSDEADYSRISVTEFSNWALSLKEEEETVTFSSVVSPAPNACPTATEQGRGYSEVTSLVGGIEWTICTDDWSTLLTELGLQAAGLKREFFLSLAPVEDSLEVEVTVQGEGTDQYKANRDWTYSQTRNSITFLEYVPDPLAVVRITYTPLADADAAEDETVTETE